MTEPLTPTIFSVYAPPTPLFHRLRLLPGWSRDMSSIDYDLNWKSDVFSPVPLRVLRGQTVIGWTFYRPQKVFTPGKVKLNKTKDWPY